MSAFGRFYLDKEKDMIVDLSLQDAHLKYRIRTPNHHSGNLISNLAKLCGLKISYDEAGLKVIEGEVPSYIDQYNRQLYIFRLGGTKVANIYPDGSVEMKASIPAISKTLMSQTKDYKLDIARTIIKTYILEETKFRSDLHTHMNANLPADALMALGIVHQIRYPLYYIKKLNLKLSTRQWEDLDRQRREVAREFEDSPLQGKYLARKIDDNTFLNFADLILGNIPDAEENLSLIRNSLAVLKDGQAVFTNLEKVYLYRYVFTRGQRAASLISLENTESIPDRDVRETVHQLLRDKKREEYRNNSLFQDKLLLIARLYAAHGIRYAEISDTSLTKPEDAPHTLEQIHRVMPWIYRETGVRLRFLAAIRRIPLTIVKDKVDAADYLSRNLRALRCVAVDPYVAGSDFVGEEINDISELKDCIGEIVRIAGEIPSFVIRIHAGENDSLRDNVYNSVRCVYDSLEPGQSMPAVRIGHGLYTANLRSGKGKELIRLLKETDTVLEFQITSNVRLNNLNQLNNHPLREYLREGVRCVQGTDGGALYGTNPIDEQLSLEKLLGLTREELLRMRRCEDAVIRAAEASFPEKQRLLEEACGDRTIEDFYRARMETGTAASPVYQQRENTVSAAEALSDQIREMPETKTPIIVVGGSFNNSSHRTVMNEGGKKLLERLVEELDPAKTVFVIGHRLSAYERYLLDINRGRLEVYSFVPSRITAREAAKLKKAPAYIRVALEPVGLGSYKSIAYEVFKRRPSVLLALDGNSAAANLVQEAKNAKYPCLIFLNEASKALREKADSLQGYVTSFRDTEGIAEAILERIESGSGVKNRAKQADKRKGIAANETM